MFATLKDIYINKDANGDIHTRTTKNMLCVEKFCCHAASL